MNDESAAWKILTLVVGLLTAAVPAYVAYDIYGRGSILEKRVELFQLTPINPLQDLSVLGERASFVLKYQKQTFKNIVIVGAWITNKGGVPVLPTDFYENLRVTVEKPWKIVAVENRGGFSPGIRVRWKRVNDTRFEAEPMLLNGGDRIDPLVYLTDTEFSDAASPSTTTGRKEPIVKWNARIANLRGFSDPPNPFGNDSLGIDIPLYGWALPFTLFAALLFLALYLKLLSRAGFLRHWNWPSISLVLCASFLAFTAAESSATYLFPNYITTANGVDHWLNAPWIVAHVLAVCVLYWQARRVAHP